MTNLIQRQLNYILCKNYPASIVDATKFIWQFRDVEPRNKLKVDPGLYSSGISTCTNIVNFVIPLPKNYDPTKYLAFYATTNLPTFVEIVSAVNGTRKAYVYGTDSTAEGEHFGTLAFQESGITSVTVKHDPSFVNSTVTIVWAMYQMPDLSLAASWKDGVQTLGVIP
jgi:hypothetical protein